MSDEAKCACNQCGEGIEFPADMAGQTVECPHCKTDTILSNPEAKEQARAPIPVAPAQRKNKKSESQIISEVLPDVSEPIRNPVIADLLGAIAVLDFVGGAIAGFIGLQGAGSYGNDSPLAFWVCASGILSGAILLGFASLIKNTNAAEKRLERIELLLMKSKLDR